MRISVGRDGDLTTFKRRVVDKSELLDIITKKPYSLSVYKNDYRNIDNFLGCDLIAVDVDEGMTIDQAKEIFKEYTYVIAPSRHHQKIKVKPSGKKLPACDRFRVILKLEKPITEAKVYYATWFFLKDLAPAIDPSCKDPSRFFYASTSILATNVGKTISPVQPKEEQERTVKVDVNSEEKGKLSGTTSRFLLQGAKEGHKHNSLFKAAMDVNEQGYSKEWFLARISELVERSGDEDYRDSGAIKTINDAFNRDPKYDAKIEQKAFKLKKVSELYMGKTEIKWIVDEFLSEGGISLIGGPPKSGKSTLIRQLISCILKDKEFLGRKVDPGPVVYLALEEQEEVLNTSFKKLGINDKDPLYVHSGVALSDTKQEDLIELLYQIKPKLLVIDTIIDYMNTDVNNYNEVKKKMSDLQTIARDTRCHIVLIHHTKKPMTGHDGKTKLMGENGFLGSTAFTGGVDSFMIVEVEHEDRYITSKGRGVKRWFQVEIKYNADKETYTIGKQRKED